MVLRASRELRAKSSARVCGRRSHEFPIWREGSVRAGVLHARGCHARHRGRGLRRVLESKGSSTERRAEIVRLRKRYLPLAAVLGVAVAVLPALAASSTAKLEVNENLCAQLKLAVLGDPGIEPAWSRAGRRHCSRRQWSRSVDHGQRTSARTGTAPAHVRTVGAGKLLAEPPQTALDERKGACTFAQPRAPTTFGKLRPLFKEKLSTQILTTRT